MQHQFPDAAVEGYESLIDDVQLPDTKDRHVVAAGVRGKATVIVTANIKDFPRTALLAFGLEAVSPDRFLCDLLDLFPNVMLEILTEQSAALHTSLHGSVDVLASLQRSGVPDFVAEIKPRFER